MPAPALHPLDARFLKLALVQQLLSPAQVKQAEESYQRRLARGQAVTIEQILQEDGYLTDTECQSLWELIAQAADTHAREQISKRREALDVATSEAPAIPTDIGHLPDLGEAYHILGLIGRGGMGTVFRARQLNMDREVALKVLRADLTANARYIRRFIREARAAGQLDHPNLVRVYDVGEAGSGGWFMAMEYVEGRTVRHLLRREGRLDLLDSLRILAQVTAALECAHRSKIVHRDIKPDNIMITPRGVAKLCDLGLAKALEGPLQDTDTQEGSTLGTPHYMSPEQAQGRPLDERSDLFSLGATLYHMVTGRVPFVGQSALEIMLKVSTQDPEPPEHIEPLLPPPVCKLIRRLMARDPRERPESATVVRRELESLCRDLASGRIFAYDDRLATAPISRRVFRPTDRYRVTGLAAAAFFLLLCIALRASNGNARIPPVEPLVLVAPVSQAGTEGERVPAPPDPITKVAGKSEPEAPPPDEGLIDLEKRLAQPNADWPALLAELDRWEQAHVPTPVQDRARLASLREKLNATRSAAAGEEWNRRWPAVQAFFRARQFTTARALLDGVPAHLRPALKEHLDEAQARLEREAEAWIEQTRTRFGALQQAGHLRLAGALLTGSGELLDLDGAPTRDARRDALQALAEAFAQGAVLRQNQAEMAARSRNELERKLKEIRQASADHDIAFALALCEKALAGIADAQEAVALRTERERLIHVQRLFQTMAGALAGNRRVISEKDFRPGVQQPGLVIGMNERHLIVQVPNAGRPDNEANIPLKRIARAEMRGLIEQVFSVHELAADDPVGRLAYDLDDGGAETRAKLYDVLSKGGAPDQAWLALILEAEGLLRQQQAAARIAEAEQLYLKNRFAEALRSLAAAREVLGNAPDQHVDARLEDLLEITACAEEQSRLLGGTWAPFSARLDASAVELAGTWSWQPVQPQVEEGRLTFDTENTAAEAPWRLVGRCQVECDLSAPAAGRTRFALAFGDGLRTRSLCLETNDGAAKVALETLGQPAPAWAGVPLDAVRGRVRLWLATKGEQLSWGIDDKTLGTYFVEPGGEWSVHVSGRGGIQLCGLRAHGTVEVTGKNPRDPGAALLREVLGKPVGSRLRALREALASPLLSLPQRAQCYATIADENRTLGLADDAHAWDALALYACPANRLPPEIRAREAEHRQRQEEMERKGIILDLPSVISR